MLPSAKMEIAALQGLVPLLLPGWKLKWSPEILATDASGYTDGIFSPLADLEVVKHVGRLSERSRFACAHGHPAGGSPASLAPGWS